MKERHCNLKTGYERPRGHLLAELASGQSERACDWCGSKRNLIVPPRCWRTVVCKRCLEHMDYDD